MSDTWMQFEYSTQPLIFVALSTVNEMVFISVFGRQLEKYLGSECWCKQFFLAITTLVNIRWCILDLPAHLVVLRHQCYTRYTWCTVVVLTKCVEVFCFYDVLRAEPQKNPHLWGMMLLLTFRSHELFFLKFSALWHKLVWCHQCTFALLLENCWS